MANISIVIPCYPLHIKYLENTFNDIINQSLLPYEVILSISGTTNEEKNIIYNQYNTIFNSKKIIFKIINTVKQQYAGINRNMGGDIANSEYIMFIDADDNIHPQKIEITKYYLNKYQPNLLTHGYKYGTEKDFQFYNDYTKINIVDNNAIFNSTFGNPPKRFRKREAKGIRTFITMPKNTIKNFGPAHGYPTIKKILLQKYRYTNLKRGQDSLFIKDILWSEGNIIHLDAVLLNYNKKLLK